ncbi:MAG TPA: hypothetical protein VLV45_13215 [Gemmatimonadales bacterium]|nr:hypothetical protein [Gemmatimonadales bacterium]
MIEAIPSPSRNSLTCGANGGAKQFISPERWQSHRRNFVLKKNGQRWLALAVQDYESRALPLSYGGAVLT